ncbi:MAG: phosphatidylinositol-3-phosphatase [Mycobacteriales bacterium]
MRIGTLVAALTVFAAGATVAGVSIARAGGPAADSGSRTVHAAAIPGRPGSPAAPAAAVPAFDHIVVVIEENHSFGEVVGNANAPYISSLATGGATLTQSFAVTHPSQPNYLALFSGSTQGVTSDACPHSFTAENLGHQLRTAGRTFAGYSETMPSVGFTGCTSGRYARKHNPWVNFGNVPAADSLRFSDFPTDFSTLPSLAFVIPNLCSDMHDCGVSTGDTWLRGHLGAYATWAAAHNSLLIVTFDEDDSSASNQIPTVLSGAHVRTGRYSERVTHYGMLRTLQTAFGLGCVANSCSATAIADTWS